MMKRVSLLLFVGLLLLFLNGCGEIDCTANLVFYSVSVVDSTGDPVEQAQVEVIHVPSGSELHVADRETGRAGEYIVVTSNHVMSGPVRNWDKIDVRVTKGNLSASAEYSVRTDSVPCHPIGLEGPSELVLE